MPAKVFAMEEWTLRYSFECFTTPLSFFVFESHGVGYKSPFFILNQSSFTVEGDWFSYFLKENANSFLSSCNCSAVFPIKLRAKTNYQSLPVN